MSCRFATNSLGALAPAIGGLKQLRRLDLRNCGLLTLPGEVAKLPALDKLDLRRNRGLDAPWLDDRSGAAASSGAEPLLTPRSLGRPNGRMPSGRPKPSL